MAKTFEYNATVVSTLMLTDYLMVMSVRPDATMGGFVPGQYATIGLTGDAPRAQLSKPDKQPVDPAQLIRRPYSISSNATSDEIEFYLALVEDGALTPRLFALQTGDRMYMAPKIVGKFTLEEVADHKNLILLSTGTGLAPYMSMLRTGVDWSKNRKIIVAHGVRHEEDLGYREELEALEKAQSNFFYLPVLSRQSSSWKGKTGYIQNVLFEKETLDQIGLSLSPEKDEVFICGNPSMIQAAIETLQSKGFAVIKGRNPGQIHIEEYW
ncbi:MAG: ferredoxin--NADP reductase [Bdellovibrionales bacterium]|nr:ferredoxin--NADP reductase [Bdellovibrionales bacterium]